MSALARTARAADAFASRLNWLIERVCALLVAVMVLIIWWGVVTRYFIGSGGVWTEELSRYVMIWAALLAVPVGAYRREHIGLDLVAPHLPETARVWYRVGLDAIGLAFFLFLTIYGVGMTKSGMTQFATIFGMTMTVPFASVPVSSALTAWQIGTIMLRDVAAHHAPEHTAEILCDCSDAMCDEDNELGGRRIDL